MTLQYMDHLAPLHKPEVLVIPLSAYDLVLELAWFDTHKPDINWATGWLTSLRSQSCQGEARRSAIIVEWYEGWDDKSSNIWLPAIGGSRPTINLTSEIPVDLDG